MLETLKELMMSDPFTPFQIAMSNGDRFVIENPSLLALSENVLSYYLPGSVGVAHLRLNQISFLLVNEPK
jgi:hypothetical protein